MAYESQIAGVGDNPPGRPVYARAIRYMQRKSGDELAKRRDRCRGPSGVAAGVCQRRRDGLAGEDDRRGGGDRDRRRIRALPPAAVRQLPRFLRPASRPVRASGGTPARTGRGDRAGRLPSPYLPTGLRLDSAEGAGEVQAPLLGPAADSLRIGDRAWLRHAKAGELCERFNELHLIEDDTVVATVPAYRGEGQAFG
jgi:hypothetical protein